MIGQRLGPYEITAKLGEGGMGQPLLTNLQNQRGIARFSGDGRWLYMLDSRSEGDLWMASRQAPPAAR